MAREIALLTNPSAGKGKGSRSAAIALPRLREAGFVVRLLSGRDGDEALDIARACLADGVESLVVCGGDGMVHIAAQALANSTSNLGIIPAGTGNDVARYLGIPRNDPQAAADVVVGSHVRTIDLARAGSKYFVTVLASGFDSKVNERANEMSWPKGQMRYTLATLAELRVFEPLPYTLEMDGVTRHLDAMLVAVGNGPSFGGGLKITIGAEIDDGLLDVVILHPQRFVSWIPLAVRVLSRATKTDELINRMTGQRVVLRASSDIPRQLDGDSIGAGRELRMSCVHGRLLVRVPR